MNTSRLRNAYVYFIAICAMALTGCGLGFVAEKRVELTHEMGEAIQHVSVSSVNGEIKIVGAETNTIDVKAHLIVRASTQKLADSSLEKLEVTLEESGNRLTLKANTPRTSFGLSYIVNYEITCPNDVAVSLRTTNGKMFVEGMRGGVDAETTNGEIHLGNVAGRIRANTTNGRVHGTVLTLSESGDFATVNGQVDVRFLECLASVNGNAVNGQVVLHLPEGFDGRIDASVVNGNIRSDFDVQDKDEGRRHLRGRIGEGGDITIRLSSVNGQVKIGKSSG